ncbi:MAG: glycosyl transferase [Thermosynechococcus sp.]|uniref:glycosyltransferase family 4 protein n=1 Tax=Thermosynechococcus sp. TaxID=2814275 RepID=UPI0021FA0D76|nr:glycosyltransferase family 4 protein [Thermosynechococcus sp.]BCX13137.1 MAG: glycosyl transferase [Thermosynechococcus sp.]
MSESTLNIYNRESYRLAIIGNKASMLINFRKDLIIDLTTSGYSVHCIVPVSSDKEKRAILELGASFDEFYLERNSVNPFHDIRTLVSLVSVIKKVNPFCILAFTAKPIVWGLTAAKLLGIKKRFAVFTGLGYFFCINDSMRDKCIRNILALLYKITLPSVTKVIFQNSDDCAEIKKLCQLPGDKVALIKGTGVNFNEWHFSPAPTSPLVFTLAARLLREKGVLEFLQAASRLKANYPKVEFWVLGDFDTNPGSLVKEDLQKFIDDGIIQWFGFVDCKTYFGKTSIFVLPSYREGIPRSIQEAMAVGRAIITTDTPGCRETVIYGYNGFLVPPRDVNALTKAMEAFVHQPELVHTMGYHSYLKAVEDFDVKKINAQYLQLFAKELGE